MSTDKTTEWKDHGWGSYTENEPFVKLADPEFRTLIKAEIAKLEAKDRRIAEAEALIAEMLETKKLAWETIAAKDRRIAELEAENEELAVDLAAAESLNQCALKGGE